MVASILASSTFCFSSERLAPFELWNFGAWVLWMHIHNFEDVMDPDDAFALAPVLILSSNGMAWHSIA